MRSVNLDQLRALVEVVGCGSFSAAARRLNLTQPAVSLQVRELERRYGVRLIERMGKQAHATVPGRQLVEAARRIFTECDLADAEMRRYREGWLGRVRLGTTLTAMIYRLPPILRALRSDYPGIDLMVNNMPTPDSIAGILQNKLDLALVNLPVEKRLLRLTPLQEEAMVAIFPADTPGLPERVTPAYLAEQPLLVLMEQKTSAAYPLVMRWLSANPRSAREPMPLGTVEALKSAVASSLGMAIVPAAAVPQHMPNVTVRPLHPPLRRTLALVEHRNKPNDPALDIVRKALLGLKAGSGEDLTAATASHRGRKR